MASTEICTNYLLGNLGIGARGDNGGPLILQKNNTDLLIGIATNKPSVFVIAPQLFTRISSFRKWIDESMINATASDSTTTTVTTKSTGTTTTTIRVTSPGIITTTQSVAETTATNETPPSTTTQSSITQLSEEATTTEGN